MQTIQVSEPLDTQLLTILPPDTSTSFQDINEVQTITLQEALDTQTIDLEPGSGSFTDTDEVQRVQILESLESQTVAITPDSGTFVSTAEVQTITLKETLDTQTIDLVPGSGSFTDTDEVQRVQILESLESQTVAITPDSGTFASTAEVQVITLTESLLTQTIAVAADTPIVAGSYKLSYNGNPSSSCISHDTSAGDVEAQSSLSISDVTVTTSGGGYTVVFVTPNTGVIALATADVAPPTAQPLTGRGYLFDALCHYSDWWLGTHTGGQHFKLTFDTSVTDTIMQTIELRAGQRETTGTIDWEAAVTATNGIQTQLNALTNIGSSGVTVTRSTTASNEGYVWTVTFSGTAVQGNVPLLSVTDDNLGSGNTYDDTHSLTVATTTPSVFPGFRITYAGETTGCIGWDAEVSGTRASMQSRLEALSTVTSVSVTKSTVSTTGRQFLITFTTPSDTVEMSSATAHSSCETFSGATPTFAITSTGGIGSRADGNYFKLTFDAADSDWPFNSGNSEETGEIDWTSDTDIKTKLESLSSIGSGALTVTASNNDLTNEGNTWLITFAAAQGCRATSCNYRLAPIR